METWDLVLLVVAGYVGTVTLVRLMNYRRDQMLQRLHEEVERERRRKTAAQIREKQQAGRRAGAA